MGAPPDPAEFERFAAMLENITDEQKDKLKEILDLQEKSTAQITTQITKLAQQAGVLSDLVTYYESRDKYGQKLGPQLETERALQQTILDLEDARLAKFRARIKAGEKIVGDQIGELKILQDQEHARKLQRKAMQNIKNELGDIADIYAHIDLMEGFFGADTYKGWVDNFEAAGEQATKFQKFLAKWAAPGLTKTTNILAGLGTQLGAQAPAVEKFFGDFAAAANTTELATVALQKSMNQMTKFADAGFSKLTSTAKDMVLQFDKQTKAMERQLQLGPTYTADVKSQYKELNELGATMENVSQAQMVLTQVVTDYTMMTRTQRKELSEAAVVAGLLGQKMEDYGAGVQMSMKIMGQSVTGAIEIQGELAATAQELGRDQTEFAAAFAKSGGMLAKFGKQGVEAFKGLQHAAKITGLEMGKILNLTNKFDTFESAAEMTGKLNAALGGNFVNAMDMMMDTDPVSRFQSIRDAILDTGLEFDTMSYYQKQFYTESLGLGDVGDLAMMLSGNLEDLAGATNLSADELIAQKEAAKGVMDIQMKLQAIITKNADTILEFVDVLYRIVDFVTKHSKTILYFMGVWKILTIAQAAANVWLSMSQLGVSKTGTKAALVIGLIVTALAAMGIAMMMASPSELVAAVFTLGIAIFGLGRISGPAAAQVQALAIPMMQLGAGVFLAAAGLALLAASFSLLNVSQMIGLGIAFGVLVAAIALMGIFGVAAAPGIAAVGAALIPLGFAMVMMGAGIGMAATGLGAMAAGFSLMSEKMDPVKMVAFGIMLGIIAAASLFLPAAGGGMAALGIGTGIFAASLYLMQPAMVVLTEFIKSMILLTGSVSDLGRVAEEFKHIAEAIDEIPAIKAMAVSVMATTMARAATAAATASPRAMATRVTQLAEAAPALGGGGTAAGGARQQNVTFEATLKLDGDRVEQFLKGQAETVLADISRDGIGLG